MTLTDRGRDVLEANRYDRDERTHEPRQAFYAGLRKPRELTHDTNQTRMFRFWQPGPDPNGFDTIAWDPSN